MREEWNRAAFCILNNKVLPQSLFWYIVSSPSLRYTDQSRRQREDWTCGAALQHVCGESVDLDLSALSSCLEAQRGLLMFTSFSSVPCCFFEYCSVTCRLLKRDILQLAWCIGWSSESFQHVTGNFNCCIINLTLANPQPLLPPSPS